MTHYVGVLGRERKRHKRVLRVGCAVHEHEMEAAAVVEEREVHHARDGAFFLFGRVVLDNRGHHNDEDDGARV